MTETATSISLGAWFATPPGAYLLDWEQRHLDEAVADVFGFHALQLGLPQLDALRGNRMPHRWLAVDTPHRSDVLGTAKPPGPRGVALNCDFDALPFDAAAARAFGAGLIAEDLPEMLPAVFRRLGL